MKERRTRRLSFILCAALLLSSLMPAAASAEETADAFDSLRGKWFDVLTGGTLADTADPDQAGQIRLIEEKAEAAWDSLQTGDARIACDCLWLDLTGTTLSGNNVVAYDRLRSMALAYKTPGSGLYGNDSLLSAVIDALDWNYANRYNEHTVRYGNWYHWEMSGPQNLMDTVILLYDELSSEQIGSYMRAVKAFSPDPNLTRGVVATGANRVEKAWVYMLRGIIVKDGSEIALARDALSDATGTETSTNGLNNVFAYTTVPEADGMHEDGSFLQHGPHPYIGNYGTTFFQLIANAVYLLSGSPWEVTDPRSANVFQWVYDSFAPTLYKGGQMDMFRGRLISNAGVQSHVAGHRVIQGVLTTMMFAPPDDAAAFAGMIKSWVTGDTFRDFLVNAPIFYSANAKKLIEDPAIEPYGDMVMNKIYTQSDRVVHRRPDFAFGISMSSSRVFRYESINGNNLHGWRTGDGATYLYNGDLGHYDEDYWPTVDPYRLSGITADAQPLADGAGQSTKTPYSWVGGVSDGEFGAAGMQFQPYGTSLTGYKSWFMFDDEIVALGAGITSASDYPVETIVENRRIDDAGTALLTVNGQQQPTDADGAEQSYMNVSWAHLAGSEAGSDIGYYFPAGGTVIGSREVRTGTWGAIQGPAETVPITRTYQKLWFDHGTKPSGAAYEYVLLPNKSAEETARYAEQSHIRVLANTAEVQAVQETDRGIAAANFWTDKTATAAIDGTPWISSASKASVMTRRMADTLEVTVSDPTQSRTEPLSVEIHEAAEGVVSQDSRIRVLQLRPTVKLAVDAAGAKGSSFRIKLALTSPDGDSEPPSAPSQLSATPVSKSAIRLSWAPSSDNHSVAGYEVYRNGAKVGVAYSPYFVDEGLAPNTVYRYAVSALDTAGLRSGMSETVSAATLDVNAYLIRDDFDDAPVGEAPAGYTLDLAGGRIAVAGIPDASDRSLEMADTSSSLAAVASKAIGDQSEPVRLQFKLMLPSASSYHSWNLQGDGTVNAVTIMTSGRNLIFKNAAGGDTVLQPYTPGTWYTVAVLADPVSDRANIYVDGIVRASGVPFRKAVSTLNAFAASTGATGTGTHYLDDIEVYPFTVWIEDAFDQEPPGTAPRGYTVASGGGSAAIAESPGRSGGSLRLQDDSPDAAVSAEKSFISAVRTALEFDLMLPDESRGFTWSLLDEAGGSAAALEASGSELVALGPDGTRQVVASLYPDVWYKAKLMVDVPKKRYMLFLNGRKAAELALQHPVSATSRLRVSSAAGETGIAYTDNVKVYPFEFLIDDDYDAEPTGASPTGYVLDARGGPIAISDTPSGTDKSLRFEDSTSRASVATKTFFTQRQSVVAKFDVMLPAYGTYHSWNLKDGAGTNGITIMSSYLNRQHVFVYKNASGGDTVIQPYSEGTWYRFKIIADPDSNRFSLYVNGELKVSDQGFRYSVSHLAGFAASTATGGSGTFYLDNLRVYPAGFLETEDSDSANGTRISVLDDGNAAQTGNADYVFTIYAKAWDPDGDPMTVAASAGGTKKTVVLGAPPRTEPEQPNVELSWSGSELPEGEHAHIAVTARDAFGDEETAVYAGTFLVDKTAPEILFDGAGEYDANERITVTCTASDTVTGVTYSDCGGGPLVDTLAYLLAPGTYTVTAHATDAAGNAVLASAGYTVRVTPEGVARLIHEWVEGPGGNGVAKSLLEKLEKRMYAPFIHEVQAQQGKMITQAHAELLIRLIDALS
ncbi:polysaccharide lyase family 8 super-sandwich domain-containing protein [Paenibacillus sp.]|uniref:polysaccharide lyase family 8 super-sandwich domain-containing protein n=1 Tax=Paenibacillus sp. TaxID=58172 RepID=UPI002D5DE486|nr:polysaccharide lyase family 8 super-sandwich domain-containing protein [Paenibacillus sp.]HZG83643.1 polysaccharide lyase family 8 super-sandwich domain-containing protein [Paenibacillus sp.]